MALAEKQLGFTLEKNTQSYVSQQTGIPQSTISYVSRGLRELPSIYDRAMRNFYQREAYRRLYAGGVSSYQADRFKWYVPDSVHTQLNNLFEKINFLATGALASTLEGLNYIPTDKEYISLFELEKELMKQSTRKSSKPLESIFDY